MLNHDAFKLIDDYDRDTQPPSDCPTPYICDPLENVISDLGMLRSAVERIETNQTLIMSQPQRIERAIELSFEKMQDMITGSVPPKKKTSKLKIASWSAAVPIVAALISWGSSYQIEKIKAANRIQIEQIVQQRSTESDHRLEQIIERASSETVKKVVEASKAKED